MNPSLANISTASGSAPARRRARLAGHRPRVHAATALALLFWPLAGCQRDEATLALTIRADAELQLDKVEIAVRGGGRADLKKTFAVAPAAAGATTSPDIRWQITVPDVTTSFMATVEVRGSAGGNELVTLVADAGISAGVQVSALLELKRACRGVACPGADRTCVDGVCRPHPTFGPVADASVTVDGGSDVPTTPDASAADRSTAGDADDARGPTDSTTVEGGGPGANGSACTRGSACASGNCVESVCCDKPCADACSSCRNALTASAADGTCAVIASGKDDPQGRCGAPAAASTCGNTSHCDGKGACEKYGSTTVCQVAACAAGVFTAAATCDGKGACAPGQGQDCKGFACTPVGGCATACATDPECPGGYCSPLLTCAAKKIDGAACAGNIECLHGQCVGGVCCESACTGLCLSCASAETGAASGLCRPIVAGGSSKGRCAIDSVTCGHDGSCDGNGACRFRVAMTSCGATACADGQLRAAPACDGAGLCVASATTSACGGGVVCASATACKSAACVADTDCVSTSYCLNGACTAKLANGASCAGNSQCGGGNCIGNICCETACTATCNSCAMVDTGAANGLCRPIKAGAGAQGKCAVDTAPCGRDGSCDGKGACALARSGTNCGTPACTNAALRAAPTCDGAGNCVPAATTTPCPGGVACGSVMSCGSSSCARDTDCAAGNYCAAGGVCTPTKANGAVCVGGNECAAGNCAGSVCCETACTDTCLSCATADTGLASGLCRPIKSGLSSRGKCPVDVATCGRDGTCDGAGACHFSPAATKCADPACTNAQLRAASTCNGSGTCVTPTTTTACAGGVVCASTTACKATTCSTDTDCVSNLCLGTACTPRKANGQVCATDRECLSNSCADGVCCNTDCTGSCEFCNVSTALAGTCSLVSSAPRTGHAACGGTGTCAGTCNGSSAACVFPGTSVSCRVGSCATDGSLVQAATCDGAGTCPPGAAASCAPFVCGGGACPQSCTGNAQCASNAACVGSTCTVCAAGRAVCNNACADLNNDQNNCGACGHGCLGGTCSGGFCQAIQLGMIPSGASGNLIPVGSTLYVTAAPLQTSPNLWRMDANVPSTPVSVLTNLFGNPNCTVNGKIFWVSSDGGTFSPSPISSCVLTNCAATVQVFTTSIGHMFGGPICDTASGELVWADNTGTEGAMVLNIYRSPTSGAANPRKITSFAIPGDMQLQVGFASRRPDRWFFTRGTIVQPFVTSFWFINTSTANSVPVQIASGVPGPNGLNVGVLVYATDSLAIWPDTSGAVQSALSAPLPGGVGSAAPPVFYPGYLSSNVIDAQNVYGSFGTLPADAIGRCPLSNCSNPTTIIRNQSFANSFAQDATAIYWATAAPVNIGFFVWKAAK